MLESLKNYYCFITTEALNSLKSWMDFRQSSGEEINGESWLMRDLWQTTKFNKKGNSYNYGLKYPKKLKVTGVKSLIERAMRAQRLVMPLPQGS